MSGAALKYTNDVHMHTGLDIHACWVYELVCEGDQQASVSRCVFAHTGFEKNKATKANKAS